jgi:hypothetical protein
MLRRWTIGAGLAMILAALVLASNGYHIAAVAPLLVWGVIVAGSVMIERYRYKPELDAPPGPDWVDTGECSVGPSGPVTVWFHPSTGERAYVRGP